MRIRRYLDEPPLAKRFLVKFDQWIIPDSVKFDISLDQHITDNIRANQRLIRKFRNWKL